MGSPVPAGIEWVWPVIAHNDRRHPSHDTDMVKLYLGAHSHSAAAGAVPRGIDRSDEPEGLRSTLSAVPRRLRGSSQLDPNP